LIPLRCARRERALFLLLPIFLLPLSAALQVAAFQLDDRPASKPAGADAYGQIQPPPPAYHLPNGQTLTYEVEWRLFDAGTATVHLEPAGSEEKVVVTADSIGAVGLLFHVHDRLESSFNPKTFCSQSVSKQTEEGFRRVNLTLRFDSERGKSVLDEINLRDNQKKHVENDIPACVTDVLSGLFYIAARPLITDSSFSFPINDGGKTNHVEVVVEKDEQVKVPAGTYNAIRVQPETPDGPLKNKGQILIWYSDDQAHTPVQMHARLFWGSLTLRLSRIDGK
jgi:hypothetical protein